MGFPVYDYRKDIRNILVTPQIRSRFLRMELGQVNKGHTHDLGHEIFLILQGQAEFEIDGEKEVLGPGQLCIALVDQNHTVRNVGNEPVIMYLSVTPHIQPTHTSWTEAGEKEPPRFMPSTAYDVPADQATPTAELADRHLQEVEVLVRTMDQATAVQHQEIAAFKQALAQGNKEAALAARDKMWAALSSLFSQTFEMAGVWNDLAARTTDSTL
jgi:quercetin dioxygenase-like cupin family protein